MAVADKLVTNAGLGAVYNDVKGKIGTLSNLTTTEKTNVVGAVNELKADLQTLESAVVNIDALGDKVIDWVTGYYIVTNTDPVDPTPVTSPSGTYRYAILDTSEGDVWILNAKGGTSPRTWCFVDAEYNVLAVSGVSFNAVDFKVIAPTGATKIIVNDGQSTVTSSYRLNPTTDTVDRLASYVDDGTVLTPTYTVEVGGLSASGEENSNGSAPYKRTGYIKVSDITGIIAHPTSGTTLYYCLYDSSASFIGSKTSISSGNVPLTGATYVRMTGYHATQLTETDFRRCFTVNSSTPYVEETLETIKGRVDALESAQDDTADVIYDGELITETLYYPNADTWANGFMDKGGSTSTSSSLMRTSSISVSEGERFVYRAKPNTSSGYDTDEPQQLRYVCAFDSGGNAVSNKGGEYLSSYTVPAGIASIVITVGGQVGATNWLDRRIVRETFESKAYLKKEPIGAWRQSGDLSDGEAFVFPENNVKNGKVISFAADISTFDKIIIGRTEDGTYTDWDYFAIDDTNITKYRGSDQQGQRAHGLTIQNNIQISIETDADITVDKITIVSDGVMADMSVSSAGGTSKWGWLGDKGRPFVLSDGSTLTSCKASWTSKNIKKPIWIFGDSYISLYAERWMYYVVQNGFDTSCLINGYAGEMTKGAIASLKNLLQLARPQYIVWAMGMNDPDSSNGSTPNARWKEHTEKMLEYCEAMAITPILVTIPNVPTQKNTEKNSWIMASGKRYIDLAAAVGATATGATWYTGMLSGDGIHTTEKGAKACYMQVLADFPEIVVQ